MEIASRGALGGIIVTVAWKYALGVDALYGVSTTMTSCVLRIRDGSPRMLDEYMYLSD